MAVVEVIGVLLELITTSEDEIHTTNAILSRSQSKTFLTTTSSSKKSDA
jgi:hypothetical protein